MKKELPPPPPRQLTDRLTIREGPTDAWYVRLKDPVTKETIAEIKPRLDNQFVRLMAAAGELLPVLKTLAGTPGGLAPAQQDLIKWIIGPPPASIPRALHGLVDKT